MLCEFKRNLHRSAPRIHDACAFALRLALHALGPYAPQCTSCFFKLSAGAWWPSPRALLLLLAPSVLLVGLRNICKLPISFVDLLLLSFVRSPVLCSSVLCSSALC